MIFKCEKAYLIISSSILTVSTDNVKLVSIVTLSKVIHKFHQKINIDP